MKRCLSLILVLFTCAALVAWAQDDKGQANLVRRTLTHGGVERTYHVHYPKNRLPTAPCPLLLVLHGGGGADAATLARRTGFNEIADREGFIVVYPAGIDGQWNDGRGKTFRRAKDNTGVDDIGFISSLIDRFVAAREADAQRVYVTGQSNGGMMTHRIGIELGDKVAAIAAGIANIPVNLATKKPVRPLPVLIMNGTADPMVPWGGGPVRVFGKDYGDVVSTERTVRYWVEAAHLPKAPKKQTLEDRVPADRCRVEVETYAAEDRPTEVVLYRIVGGGHNLPGGNTPDRPLLVGRQCKDINGPEVIGSFFKKHALAAPPQR